MDALTIRRYKGLRMPNYPETNRTEKASASNASKNVSRPAALRTREDLRLPAGQAGRLESQFRANRRTLQTGEAVLEEVQSSLERMAELARRTLGGGDPAALQKELEQLRDEIGRMLGSTSADGERLFLEDGAAESAGLYAGDPAGEASEQEIPDWLVRGILQGAAGAERLLASLGLDKTAGSVDIMAAAAEGLLEDNPSSGYLAAMYLGAVISGTAGDPDQISSLQGLQQLFEQVAKGVPLDEAVASLTNGAFTGMADFESQFIDGTAPDMETFLNTLLLNGVLSQTAGMDLSAVDLSALALLGDLNGMDLSMLLLPSLFDMLEASGGSAQPQAGQQAELSTQPDAAGASPVPQAAPQSAAQAASGSAPAGNAPIGTSSVEYGAVQVTGRDLSGVAFDAGKNVLAIGGTADVTVRGTGRDGPQVVLNGSGTVTLRGLNVPLLTVGHGAARISGAGGNVLGELRLLPNAALTFGGSGRLEVGALRTGGGNRLYLTGGAVAVRPQADGTPQTVNIPVTLDGAASFAAHAASVRTPEGKSMDAFDIIWKTFLPGWDSVSSVTVDGRQAKMELLEKHPLRRWMNRGESGYPVHTVTLRGRDKSGQERTRYAYLRWNRREEAFEEIAMYPNAFRVTGGEEHQDWLYDAASQTLRILTGKVTDISGGIGTDANGEPFSGRIALSDNIGDTSLTLDGVVCRVSSGRAFSLGRGNHVTLLLKSGTDNHFESGAGYAGISVLDGAALCIDCAAAHSSRDPLGTLTASGGRGGAGIGRDGRGSRDRTSSIEIRGGIITAAGAGGGAGIGAGKRSAMGPVTITGGMITAAGTGGGAGIGGAWGAPVGDISISGGTITATAAEHAAAIGAGVQGESGNIVITGYARIKKAAGGDPGVDIGACLFGGCGRVEISGSADIGCARTRRKAGIPLRMGDDTVTLPQYRLSVPSLKLDRLSVLTREYAQHTISTIDTDRRWIAQIQDIYRALYTQIEQNHMINTRQYVRIPDGPVRDTSAAGTLLQSMSRSIPSSGVQIEQKDARYLFR